MSRLLLVRRFAIQQKRLELACSRDGGAPRVYTGLGHSVAVEFWRTETPTTQTQHQLAIQRDDVQNNRRNFRQWREKQMGVRRKRPTDRPTLTWQRDQVLATRAGGGGVLVYSTCMRSSCRVYWRKEFICKSELASKKDNQLAKCFFTTAATVQNRLLSRAQSLDKKVTLTGTQLRTNKHRNANSRKKGKPCSASFLCANIAMR